MFIYGIPLRRPGSDKRPANKGTAQKQPQIGVCINRAAEIKHHRFFQGVNLGLNVVQVHPKHVDCFD
ncbi:hypothetical protein M8C21_013685 [Ambrosia artemisiifolia]|uniref:Uncharacterized protein n=1 Tax=Ambrosia artemisiifolia TaxID=4212 RepID=A0AAD5DEN8_AMBAR|nr:hypothetical protein M8C21_013685 [Ambrosia artemisiifolia]